MDWNMFWPFRSKGERQERRIPHFSCVAKKVEEVSMTFRGKIMTLLWAQAYNLKN